MSARGRAGHSHAPGAHPGVGRGAERGGGAARKALRRRQADAPELEERTRQAYAAKTRGDLAPLLEDLPPEPPAEPAAATRPAAACGRRRWGMRSQLASFLGTALFFVAIWALTGRGYFWPAWPLVGWGVALVARAVRGPEEPRQLRHTRAS